MWSAIAVALIGGLYLIFRAYVKLTYRFWSKQPVFHWYDLLYYVASPKRVEKGVPLVDEYVNLVDIRTTEIDEEKDKEAIRFVRSHHRLAKHWVESLYSNNHPSFLSTYRLNNQLYGVLTARSLTLRLKGQREIPLYYLDNLCIHRGMRQRDIAPQLLRTTYYQLRRLRPSIDAYLFKREEASTAIVPLVTYRSAVYPVGSIPKRPFPHASHTLIEINREKLALLLDLVDTQRERFECVLLPDVSNLARMLEKERWHVYGILERDRLNAAYIFVPGEKWTNMVASIDACEFVDIFQIGFEQACTRIGKPIAIDRIGDSNRLRVLSNPTLEYPSSYYMYNYITTTQPNDKCLILN